MKKKIRIRSVAAIIVTIAFYAFQMYIALIKQFPPMLQGPLHLVFALTLVYIYFPADYNYRKRYVRQQKPKTRRQICS